MMESVEGGSLTAPVKVSIRTVIDKRTEPTAKTEGDQAESDSKIAILPEEKKIYICRYGSGCTHMNEPEHMSLFWHPPVPKLDERTLRTHYICNECGEAFMVLQDLQLHIQRKTAWSNKSLVRARLNVFVDGRSWQEGIVTSFRRGKHHVHFYLLGEKRWLVMAKTLFYIIYQPSDGQLSTRGVGEVKQDDGGASIDDDDEWLYIEDISLDYAFTQSVLFKVYGSTIQETGYRTRGHNSLTKADRKHALNSKGSFLYGEFLPRGVDKALRENRLNAASARTLYDLGMGIGKVVMQAFLQFRNLVYVYGVELSHGRFKIAEEAALRMVELLGRNSFSVEHVPGKSIIVTERDSEMPDVTVGLHDGEGENGSSCAAAAGSSNSRKRVLHMVQGDLLDTPHIHCADIVMLETDFPPEMHDDLCAILSKMKRGSRTLTYLDMKKLYGEFKSPVFSQLEINKAPTDRYPTSWSMQRGHRFYLWRKATSSGSTSRSKLRSKRKAGDSISAQSPSVLPQCAVNGAVNGNNGTREPDLSQQLNLSQLAINEVEDVYSDSPKVGRVSKFFTKIFSTLKRNVGPDGDRRVVPLGDSFGGGQPSRRHSRGHTEDAHGLARPNYISPSFENNDEVEVTASVSAEWVSQQGGSEDTQFMAGASCALTTRSQDDTL